MTEEKIDIETTSVDDSVKTNNNTEEKQKTFFQKIKNLISGLGKNSMFWGGVISSVLILTCLFLILKSETPIFLIFVIVSIFYLLWYMLLHDRRKVRFIPWLILFLFYYVIFSLLPFSPYLRILIIVISLIIIGAVLAINNKKAIFISSFMLIIVYTMHLWAILFFAYGDAYDDVYGDVMKPIIYLYPENKTEVSVELGNAYKISHSYPKYEKMWNVVVDSNSNILYNGRNYYGLYWEGKGSVNFDMNDGFVVKGSDSAKFLEEKLSILGLNEREANEFIIYWLPKLESNAYNFIKFASIETQNEYMPLSISPKPDTVIRVLMGYKGLNKKIEVKEQILPPKPERNGFVAVEWGGTEIGDSFVY